MSAVTGNGLSQRVALQCITIRFIFLMMGTITLIHFSHTALHKERACNGCENGDDELNDCLKFFHGD